MKTCFFGHKWTKWEKFEQPIMISRSFWHVYDEPLKAVETMQKRRCKRCGKHQEELV